MIDLLAPSYAAWLTLALEARASRYAAGESPARFTVMTTVYQRTDEAFLVETAGCLFGQSLPFFEWIILAHGPVSAALNSELERMALRPRVRLLRRAENLGIMGGMRVCLEAATGDYVIPVDADDLLTVDALAILASTSLEFGCPAFIYSDEDVMIGGEPIAPYWRPDWDPVLNLSSSYIWHLCCIRRDVALELDLYTDLGATFCHDWDTVFRIACAGHIPVHVPEVLYHWRQHPASSTNREDPEQGSRESTRHVLQSFLNRVPNPDLYEIEDFPIFRGAPEWTVTRRPDRPLPVAAVTLGKGRGFAASGPWSTTHRVDSGSLPKSEPIGWRFWTAQPFFADARDLLQAIERVEEPYLVLLSNSVEPLGVHWFWEAAKLFELHGQVALVHGLLLDSANRIQRGGEVFSSCGALVCPQFGKKAADPGPFALALKPHCASAVPTDFLFSETALMRSVLRALPENAGLAGLGIKLSAAARSAGRVTAFSPLITARIKGPLIDGAPGALAKLAEATLTSYEVAGASSSICGAAGFARHAGSYR